VEPWYPRYAGWKTVIAGCRKIVQLEGKKRSQKQLITSLKNRPFYHLLHRKGASSRTRNVTPCRCGQKNCLCRRAGIQTWRWRNGQPGSSGWLPCVLSRRKESWSWKELASQSEELVDLQAHPFFLRDKYRGQILFWGCGGFLGFIYWMLVS
jgi:hypothetical protein